MNPSILFGLAAGTLVSEDLTLISAGLLARDGAVGLVPALGACTAGVYVGGARLWGSSGPVGARPCGWRTRAPRELGCAAQRSHHGGESRRAPRQPPGPGRA